MQQLRPYQEAAVHGILNAIEDGHTRILYTQATGTGKTTVFAELTRVFLKYQKYRVLILAHRTELIQQAFNRVKDHCGLGDAQIGVEMADDYAPDTNVVVIASIATIMNPKRLANFCPNVIITDEAHHAAAASYKRLYERLGVNGIDQCLHIGCTATAKRTDKQSLYAINLQGDPAMLYDKKTKKSFPADPDLSIFAVHCFDYSVLDAIEDGYLVPIVGHSVETQTDISKVKMGVGGDFQEGALQKAVDNNARTVLAISAWESIARERPTLVFCAGVEHAHHAADLWVQAGYTAAAVDAETHPARRFELFRDFKDGTLQVLCNMGIATEGTDLPNCSCIVHLRPTKSWNLYVQMSGRGSRVLPGVVDGVDTPEGRAAAIAASVKPDCIILDLVDICAKNDLCTVPSILDLPAELDLQGHKLNEAKKMLDEFEEVKERAISACPTTYEELEFTLRHINLLHGSNAESKDDWLATDIGYRCQRIPPGYSGELRREGDSWRLILTHHQGQVLLNKTANATANIKTITDYGRHRIGEAITKHQADQPKGTFARLSQKQRNVLWHAGYATPAAIDRLPLGYARKLIGERIQAFVRRREGGGE